MAKPVLIPCPICRRMSVEEFQPFCSKRCADVDLGRWLGETYRVPGEDFSEIKVALPEGDYE